MECNEKQLDASELCPSIPLNQEILDVSHSLLGIRFEEKIESW